MDKKESRFYNIMPVFKHLSANLVHNGSNLEIKEIMRLWKLDSL